MKSVLFAATFSLLAPAIGQGQALEAGARIRVTAPRDDLRKHVTTVLEVRDDTIVVASRAGSRTVAVDNITELDVSTGTRGHMLRDGAIGFGLGAVIGGVLMKSASDDCPGGGEYGVCGVPVSESEATALGAAVYGGLGLLAGVAVGAFLDRSDRWERMAPDVRVAIAPSRSRGLSLSVSKAF